MNHHINVIRLIVYLASFLYFEHLKIQQRQKGESFSHWPGYRDDKVGFGCVSDIARNCGKIDIYMSLWTKIDVLVVIH